MGWLRANWRHVGIAAVLLFTVTGWVSAAHYMGVADTHALQSDRQSERLAVQATMTDIAREEAERVDREALARRVTDSVALAALADTAAALRVTGVAQEAAAQAEAAEHDGWMTVEAHDAVVTVLVREKQVADSVGIVEHEGKVQERARGDALQVHVTRLTARVDLLEARDTTRVAEIAALRNVKAPGFALRLKADWWMVAGGIVIGMAATR